MNNGPESFHRHFKEQFYAAYSSIFIFADFLKKLQSTLNRALNTELPHGA
jgi:ribonuclease HIII